MSSFLKKIFGDVFYFSKDSNFFSFNIKMFVFSGVSLWHHGFAYRVINVLAAIFIIIFWLFALKDFTNHLVPFQANNFMLSLNIVVIHLMGLYKFLLLVSAFNICQAVLNIEDPFSYSLIKIILRLLTS